MLECYGMEITDAGEPEAWEPLAELLPTERRERLERFQNKERRLHFLKTSLFMQYGISRTLGHPIDEITYIYEKNGKPRLSSETDPEGIVDFNLSHSGRYAVLAVSSAPVGIDVECLGRVRMEVAKRFFCPEEYREIEKAATPREKSTRFAWYWTMKEAYIKRTGEGMARGLDTFHIVRGEGGLSGTAGEEVYFATFCRQNACTVSVCSGSRQELERLLAAADQGVRWMDSETLRQKIEK